MMRYNGRSSAFFGGPLLGDKPVRFIFVDEAGTSAKEAVTVVVGLIAGADEHVMTAEALVDEVLDTVPLETKKNFVFHATEVFGSIKYRDGWSLTERLEFLKQMMRIPFRTGMAICVSAHWRGGPHAEEILELMSPAQADHFFAFLNMVGVADRNIQKHARPREVATLVAEDIPEMRKFLKLVPEILSTGRIRFRPESLRPTIKDEEAGYMQQSGLMRVSRIRKSIHFVEKPDDPLVQVADACAFGLRRFFAKQKFGEDFAQAIVGDLNHLRAFASPGGVECYWPVPESVLNDVR